MRARARGRLGMRVWRCVGAYESATFFSQKNFKRKNFWTKMFFLLVFEAFSFLFLFSSLSKNKKMKSFFQKNFFENQKTSRHVRTDIPPRSHSQTPTRPRTHASYHTDAFFIICVCVCVFYMFFRVFSKV